MKDLDRYAIAQVVLHGKEQVVLLRPIGRLIAMTMLNYDTQVVKPAAFEPEVPEQQIAPAEMDLVKTLIQAQTPKTFDFSKYKDVYTEKLAKLIEAKVAGQEIVTPPQQEEAQVINLMEALKQSVAKARHEAPAEVEAGKPPKKMAKSAPKKPAAEKKRKSS
jgi:DNA end-binding protein Ku